MDRREFVKTSALLSLPIILKSCNWQKEGTNYDIEVHSDAATGHSIRQSNSFPEGGFINADYLIVGGGIAGMAAAVQLKDKDYLLVELSDKLGGSSSAVTFEGTGMSQGAHYDLEYPKGYGEEVLSFLRQLDIIEYHQWSDSWSFKDRQHLIMHRRKSRCYDHGTFRKDVLEEGALKNAFLVLMDKYAGRMPLPTRIINRELHPLGSVSFLDLLHQHLVLTPQFIRAMDYHMKDDYGAGCAEVSALAGIHYFMCRPYYKEIVELFSPPEGNAYFINKMAKQLDPKRLRVKHLARSIEETKEGFAVKAIDMSKQSVSTVHCKKIVYAGHKHALKYIYPEGYTLFERNSYAPWMVVNVVAENALPQPAFWQNEMLTDDESLMGFVDSAAQHSTQQKYRILTAYYCLPKASRRDLLHVEADKEKIAETTIRRIGAYFDQDISNKVRRVFIKVMGHAMPIPQPGYLFKDQNQQRDNRNIAYAGVDNGRLPLLYEAVDSGLQAVEALHN